MNNSKMEFELVDAKFSNEFLNAFLTKMPVITIDTETGGLDWKTTNLKLISFCISDKETVYIIAPITDEDYAALRKAVNNFLSSYKGLLIFHNAKFDLHILKQFSGYNKPDFPFRISDTRLMGGLIDDSQNLSLSKMSEKYLNESKDANGWTLSNTIDLAAYCAKDSWLTWKLWRILKPLIQKDYYKLYMFELQLSQALLDIEEQGINVDCEYLENMRSELNIEILNYAQELIDKVGTFNPKSNEQLAEVLIKLGHPELIGRTKLGNPSVKDKDLKRCNDEYVQKILKIRQNKDLLANYIEPYLDKYIIDGKLYPNFNQIAKIKNEDEKIISTGRLSSSEPNIQNVNPILRRAFTVEEGYVHVYFDYSQIELRILAFLSKEKKLLSAYENNMDVHKQTAEALGVSRDMGKRINFSIVYGIGAKSLADYLEISPEDAVRHIKTFYNTYPNVLSYNKSMQQFASVNGYVRNIFGRTRKLQGEDCRKACNTIIQSTAADLIKRANVSVQEFLKDKKSKAILLIHDEEVIKMPLDEVKYIKDIQKIMEEERLKYGITVPTPVTIKYSNTNWAEEREDVDELISGKQYNYTQQGLY